MAFLAGEELFYVTSRGDIHDVVATENERNGAVSIKGKSIGEIKDVGTLHVCRTMRAATVMSQNRKPSLIGDKNGNY